MVPNAFEIVSGITGKYIYKTFQIVFFCSYYCQLYLKKIASNYGWKVHPG